MSEVAQKKAATAAKQVKHAVSNIEEAAELQAEEVVQNVVQAVPTPVAKTAKVAVLFIGGAVTYHFAVRGVHKLRQKREERKDRKLQVVREEVA